MTDPDEQVIRFTVKELFLDLKNDIKEIKQGFVRKADQADLAALTLRVGTLETDKASSEAVERYKKWLIGLICVIAADALAQASKFVGLIK